MTTRTIERTDTKPTPIKPQVWGCVFYVDTASVKMSDAVQVGPDEYMPPERYPTEEMAEQEGLRWIEKMRTHCFNCSTIVFFGLVKFLRAERLE